MEPSRNIQKTIYKSVSYGSKWRREWDSNPRWYRYHAGFQDQCLKPLGHLSVFRCVVAPVLASDAGLTPGILPFALLANVATRHCSRCSCSAVKTSALNRSAISPLFVVSSLRCWPATPV